MRELFSGRHGRVAAGLLIGEFVSAMQTLVIATIMPRVVADLHGLALYGFAFGSFLLANFIFLPFAGPWADRYGTRRILAVALSLLGVGLALASAAHSMAQFVGARFIEGSGAGLDYAASFAAIVKTFPERQRARMFSLVSTAWVVPAIIAPSSGALIATAYGWRWAFLGFVPCVAVAAALLLPAMGDRGAEHGVDPFGALRMLFSRATLYLKGRNAAFVAFAVLHAAFFGADAYVALLLTAVRGLSLTMAAFCITLGALGWCIASLFQPALLRRAGVHSLLICGALLGVVGCAGMISVALGAPPALAFVTWFLGGIGIGLGYPTLSLAGVTGVDEGEEGTVSSAMLLAAVLGMTGGVTLCGLPVTLAARGEFPLASGLLVTFTILCAAAFVLMTIVRRVPARVD